MTGCDSSSDDTDTTETMGPGEQGGPGGTDTGSTSTLDISIYRDLTTGDCAVETTDVDTLVCAIEAFYATLSTTDLDTVQYDLSDSEAKATWSNLPAGSVPRNGLGLGEMETDAQEAAMRVARAALSDDGYADFVGVLASDSYLQLEDGNVYGAENFYFATFGTPADNTDWVLQIGGHHLAHNITYVSGTGYASPHHIAVEPKAAFTLNSETYSPLVEDGETMVALYDAMSSTELSTAYLSGQSFNDVVMGPDNGSTTLSTYPDKEGVLVSSLSTAQQALVTAAITQWVGDFNTDMADALIAEYTSATAYSDTWVSWGGTEASGVDVDVNGTYMRIHGPRVWIELSCQQGVVFDGVTHYHAIYRDSSYDYGNIL